MASRTTVTMNRRIAKERASGHKRKQRTAKKSTLSAAELFAALGPPIDPPPKR